MCEGCANRDIRTSSTIIDPETGRVLRKTYDTSYPNLQQQINELNKKISQINSLTETIHK
ncbi:MAG TPA: hypothetical protein ENH82_09445 [bacterium]|nr:hypothetical protein [bacterium]